MSHLASVVSPGCYWPLPARCERGVIGFGVLPTPSIARPQDPEIRPLLAATTGILLMIKYKYWFYQRTAADICGQQYTQVDLYR